MLSGLTGQEVPTMYTLRSAAPLGGVRLNRLREAKLEAQRRGPQGGAGFGATEVYQAFDVMRLRPGARPGALVPTTNRPLTNVAGDRSEIRHRPDRP
jgi:hypothetical protein